MRVIPVVALLTLAIGALAWTAMFGFRTGVAATTAVSMIEYSFQPPTINIEPGTTVLWTNNGLFTHTTTSDSALWDSGLLSPGQPFSFTFNTPGTFSYKCTIHALFLNMTGTIIVTGPTPTPSPSPTPTRTPGPTPTPLPFQLYFPQAFKDFSAGW